MFDDFNYKTLADAQKNGWVARTEKGHPGIKNATWWDDSISFHPDSLDFKLSLSSDAKIYNDNDCNSNPK